MARTGLGIAIAALLASASVAWAQSDRQDAPRADVFEPISVDGCARVGAILYSGCVFGLVYACDESSDRIVQNYFDGVLAATEYINGGVLLSRWLSGSGVSGGVVSSLDDLTGDALLALTPGDARAHRYRFFTVQEGEEAVLFGMQRFERMADRTMQLETGPESVVVLRDLVILLDGRVVERERVVSRTLGVTIAVSDVSREERDLTPIRMALGVLTPDAPGFDALGVDPSACGDDL